MQLFLADPAANGQLTLAADEARHALRVLRKNVGDTLHAVDGQGTYYFTRIASAQDHRVALEVIETHAEWGEPAQPTELWVSLLKHRERFEWLLEKGVELGVTAIQPLLCERSERFKLNLERSTRVLIAALKQCKRSRLPELRPPAEFPDALRRVPPQATALFAFCSAEAPLRSQLPAAPGHSVIAIGPEGDFTPHEAHLATAAGFRAVSLGTNRLRSETAGLYALSILKFHREG